ncbi:MAG: NADH-quinone oxidoreductase subunit A, partial [Egibacteraceae bacterium]
MLPALAGALTVLAAGTFAVLVWRWLDAALARHPSDESQSVPFTGGHEPAVHAWSRYHVRYYTMAILFLAFDMEMVFM